MNQYLLPVLALIVEVLTLEQSSNDCCAKKTVGGVPYNLVGEKDTGEYNCNSNCVYELDDKPGGSQFCFKDGYLKVVCNENENSSVIDVSETTDGIAILITGGLETELTTEVYFPGINRGCSVPNYDLPHETHTHTMNTFKNKTVYCGGETTVNHCFLLTPTSVYSVWTKYAYLEEGRYEHTSWVSSAGLVQIGGFANISAAAETTAELVNGDIRILPFTLPPTRDACAIGDASSDSFILTGGQYTLSKVARYNLQGLVENLPDMNHGRSSHGCGSFNSDGKMVLIVAGGGLLDSTEKFVIGESSWSAVRPLPRTMSIVTSLNIDNKIYILGGRGSSDFVWTDILEYDTDTDAWNKVGDMQVPRYRHAAAVIQAGFADLCN